MVSVQKGHSARDIQRERERERERAGERSTLPLAQPKCNRQQLGSLFPVVSCCPADLWLLFRLIPG